MSRLSPRPLLQAISNLLHPLFMLTYGTVILMTFTVMQVLPLAVRLWLVGEVFFFTCLVPIISITILYKLHVVSHWALRSRADRAVPLAVNAVAYTLCSIFLTQHHYLPAWALAIYWGGTAMAWIGWCISLWWKVSAHAMGIVSLTTASFGLFFIQPYIMPLWIPFVLIVLSGLLCSIRLYLGRHTLAQVTVGSLIGVVSMSIAIYINTP